MYFYFLSTWLWGSGLCCARGYVQVVCGRGRSRAPVPLMLRCDLPLRSDTGALARGKGSYETRMCKTSRPFYYQNHKRSRESETPAPTTDSLDLSNYCPSDLILKRIYLRRTATAHSFTVGRPRTTPFAARAELLVIVSVLSCCSACSNQHVNESACSELKFRDKLSYNQAHEARLSVDWFDSKQYVTQLVCADSVVPT